MISGHPSALYDEMLEGWRRIAWQVTTRARVRSEVLWFNFTPGKAHGVGHAGRNKTERQRIKRKAARWAGKYTRMPACERQAVMAALMAVEAS